MKNEEIKEYYDPDNVFAIRKNEIKFSKIKIEELITKSIDEHIKYMIGLNSQQIKILRKFAFRDDIKLVFEYILKNKEITVYLEFYDDVLQKIVNIGINREPLIYDKDVKRVVFLKRFDDMIKIIDMRDMYVYFSDNDKLIYIRSGGYIGLIACLEKE